MALIGIIGGSSLLHSDYFRSAERRILNTPHGDVALAFGKGFIFCQRHQADPTLEYSQPHRINKRAIFAAFSSLGVQKVLAFGSVGSLRRCLPPGTLVMPDDFFCLADQLFFHDDNRAAVVPSMVNEFRSEVVAELTRSSVAFVQSATYVQTTGPRFETRAECRFLTNCGDVIGMTCAHEATLATELQMQYSLVCMIDNFANGISDQTLSVEDFKAGVARNQSTVESLLSLLLTKFAAK